MFQKKLFQKSKQQVFYIDPLKPLIKEDIQVPFKIINEKFEF